MQAAPAGVSAPVDLRFEVKMLLEVQQELVTTVHGRAGMQSYQRLLANCNTGNTAFKEDQHMHHILTGGN